MSAPAALEASWTDLRKRPAPTHGVTTCQTCEGRGSIPNNHGRGGNDPDSWEVECRECDGNGRFPCAVCGFETAIDGYDCLVCETVRDLRADELAAVDVDNLALAFADAVAFQRAAEREMAAGRAVAA